MRAQPDAAVQRDFIFLFICGHVKRSEGIIWLTFGFIGLAVYMVFVFLAVTHGAWEIIRSLILVIFIVVVISKGLKGVFYPDENENNMKDRDTALLLSIVSLGHLYMGRWKVTACLLPLTILSVVAVIYSVLTEPFDDINGMLMIYGGIMGFTVFAWSLTTTNELCDRAGLPPSESIFFQDDGMKTRTAVKGMSVIVFLITVLCVLWLVYDGYTDMINALPGVISTTLFVIWAFFGKSDLNGPLERKRKNYI